MYEKVLTVLILSLVLNTSYVVASWPVSTRFAKWDVTTGTGCNSSTYLVRPNIKLKFPLFMKSGSVNLYSSICRLLLLRLVLYMLIPRDLIGQGFEMHKCAGFSPSDHHTIEAEIIHRIDSVRLPKESYENRRPKSDIHRNIIVYDSRWLQIIRIHKCFKELEYGYRLFAPIVNSPFNSLYS